jgi:hypothetical protein
MKKTNLFKNFMNILKDKNITESDKMIFIHIKDNGKVQTKTSHSYNLDVYSIIGLLDADHRILIAKLIQNEIGDKK